MPGPAQPVLERFAAVEADQRYTSLLEVMADDATYYDPFFGPQVGRPALEGFFAHMEELVPKAGVRFESWEAVGGTDCGWARWVMTAPGPGGDRVPVPGQSLYRLRGGKVAFVADYVDAESYARLRPGGNVPDAASAAGLSARYAPSGPPSPALALVQRFWQMQDSGRYGELAALFADDAVFEDRRAGRFEGPEAVAGFLRRMEEELPARGITFELVDAAGDDDVAWSQWTCRYPGRTMPGWTLHRVRDGRFTLDADYFDTQP